MTEPTKSDLSYTDASNEAFARTVAEFFHSLVVRGMRREEALVVTQTWVNAIVIAAGMKNQETK